MQEKIIEELRKELKDQIEENKELNDSITWWKNRYEAQVKINEEHKQLNGNLRKENDALITVIDLAKNYMKENSKISLDDSVSIVHFYKDLLEILERVNEE